MLPFVIGGVFGVCILVYVSLKPVPQEEIEERNRVEAEKHSQAKLTKAQIEEQREMAREAVKENLFKMNPDLKNLTEEELQNVVRQRKEKFLGNMDPNARESFEKIAKQAKKEMEKVSRMSPEEIRERASEIEANEFRLIMLKLLLILMIVYFFCVFYFDSFSPIVLKEKIMKELVGSKGLQNATEAFQDLPFSEELNGQDL